MTSIFAFSVLAKLILPIIEAYSFIMVLKSVLKNFYFNKLKT